MCDGFSKMSRKKQGVKKCFATLGEIWCRDLFAIIVKKMLIS